MRLVAKDIESVKSIHSLKLLALAYTPCSVGMPLFIVICLYRMFRDAKLETMHLPSQRAGVLK
jgi:hypothetical protein